jgi:hypothetical protein
MANLPNLKWIPMIAKAYQEARTRAESGMTEMTHDMTASAEPSVRSMNPNPAHASPRKRSDSPAHARRSTRKSPGAKANSLKTASYQKVTELQSVVHELREAKRRINRLESIHRELTVMQTRLESRMNELIHRLDKTQNTKKATSMESESHPSSPTA